MSQSLLPLDLASIELSSALPLAKNRFHRIRLHSPKIFTLGAQIDVLSPLRLPNFATQAFYKNPCIGICERVNQEVSPRLVVIGVGRKKTFGSRRAGVWRLKPDSNRRTRLCRPLHSPSAIQPNWDWYSYIKVKGL